MSVLLTLVGPKVYELLCSLVSPNLPQDKTYEELAELFKRHYEPEPIVIAERFHFHRRNQVANENIAEYLAELRRLATHCKFSTFLEEALRDRLVCGLRSESIQKRLLAEKNLTLKTALDLAHGMESAHRDAKVMKGTESSLSLQKLFISPSSTKRPSASERRRVIGVGVQITLPLIVASVTPSATIVARKGILLQSVEQRRPVQLAMEVLTLPRNTRGETKPHSTKPNGSPLEQAISVTTVRATLRICSYSPLVTSR